MDYERYPFGGIVSPRDPVFNSAPGRLKLVEFVAESAARGEIMKVSEICRGTGLGRSVVDRYYPVIVGAMQRLTAAGKSHLIRGNLARRHVYFKTLIEWKERGWYPIHPTGFWLNYHIPKEERQRIYDQYLGS